MLYRSKSNKPAGQLLLVGFTQILSIQTTRSLSIQSYVYFRCPSPLLSLSFPLPLYLSLILPRRQQQTSSLGHQTSRTCSDGKQRMAVASHERGRRAGGRTEPLWLLSARAGAASSYRCLPRVWRDKKQATSDPDFLLSPQRILCKQYFKYVWTVLSYGTSIKYCRNNAIIYVNVLLCISLC